MLLGRALPLTREALKVPRLSLVRFCSSETTLIRVSNNLELRTRQNATENDCKSTKPLVLIFAWMLPQRRHLQKFENIYLARGCDVMTINIKPLQLMLPKTGAQVIAEKVVDFVHQPQNARRPLLVHAFSVGGYLYSETLLKSLDTSSEAGSMKDRIMGQVFDSILDFTGLPDGLPAAMFKSPLLRATLRTILKTYMAALYKPVISNYIRASELFHHNPVPSPVLFLYSKVDEFAPKMAAASSPQDNGTGHPIFALFQLPETTAYEEVYGAYSGFVQEYVKEQEYVKTLKVTERKSYRFKTSRKQFLELDTIFKALPTDPNTTSAKYDAEIRKLREENNRLRNRVQHLEDLTTSLQSKSSDIQKNMNEVKTSQGSLKVKVANMKDAILDKVTSTISDQLPSNQNTVLEYAVATSNRFEALQGSPSQLSSSTTDLETDPKALIQSITNTRAHTNPRPQHSTQKSKRVVIIGDSNAKKLKPGLLSPTADVPRPYWAPTLPATLSALETISKETSPPSTVVLHVGTNDTVTKSKEEIIDDFDTTICSTQSLFPNADVVISAVPPRRSSRQNPDINENIMAINKHLQDRCQANASFTFVNHAKLWSNDDHNKEMFERDGYHLNADGVRVLAYNIKKQATGPLGLQPRNLANERRQENGSSPPSTPRHQSRRYEHSKGRRTGTAKPNMTRAQHGQQGHAPQRDSRREVVTYDAPERGRQEPPVQGYNQAYQDAPQRTPFMRVPRPLGPYHPSPMYTEWDREWPSLKTPGKVLVPLTEAYDGNYSYPRPMWFGLPPPPRYNSRPCEAPPFYNGPYGAPPPYRDSGLYHGSFSRPSNGRPQGSN
ncbi:TMEM53 [Branchiostoma lanceolatum]|uniref:1-alkyl-2-acetylglycerophosphocholine esterase n=1 Tax=Branchiostoma lanceolatum TaxID=7740 RepID=A0A8J9ZQF0_BRALA|nr:TMEM53 [Branchiostoma lanceolatum]